MTDEIMGGETVDTPRFDRKGEAFLGSYDEEKPSFDLFAWMHGVKPIRRSVTLYARLDLMAERDAAAEDLKEARIGGDVEAEAMLRERITELTQQIMASRMRVVLQGISGSRFNEILEEAKKDRSVRSANDVALYQIAGSS